jgi:hypothetical protein
MIVDITLLGCIIVVVLCLLLRSAGGDAWMGQAHRHSSVCVRRHLYGRARRCVETAGGARFQGPGTPPRPCMLPSPCFSIARFLL